MYNGVREVAFCDLAKFEGQQVLIEAFYSGTDEYWSLKGPWNCKPEVGVDLELNFENEPIPEKFKPLFDSVHTNYWSQYLRIKMVGVYDSKKKQYGHLGHNGARFIPKEFIDVEILTRD